MPIIVQPYDATEDKMFDSLQGIRLFPSEKMYIQFGASTAVANSTTETTVLNNTTSTASGFSSPVGGNQTAISSLTLPYLNGLTPTLPPLQLLGTWIRGQLIGTIANTGTPTFRVRAGLVDPAATFNVLADTTAVAMTTTAATDFEINFDMFVRAYSATAGQMVSRVNYRYNATVVAGATTITSSLNLVQQLIIDVRATWGAASASNTVTIQGGWLEIF